VIDALRAASIVLAVLNATMLIVLLVRRLLLFVAEDRQARLERRLQPLALDVIDGDIASTARLSRNESRTLAIIIERYSRHLAGTTRTNVAAFFDQRGDVEREITHLGARRAWRRATAAYLLGDMAASRAVPALVEALGDRSRDVRSAAARSLGLLMASQAVPRLVECLAAQTVPRGVAGFALLTIGQATREPLRFLLVHDDAEVRAAAAELVEFLGSPSDASRLTARLADPSAEVRAAAAGALGRIGDETAASALRATLDDRIPFVRTAAAESLAALDDVDASDALAWMAGTDEHEPALAAARALARISPEDAISCGRAPGAGPYLLQAAGMARLGR
jgi:hypothetical protein